jgi:hypothetical protein
MFAAAVAVERSNLEVFTENTVAFAVIKAVLILPAPEHFGQCLCQRFAYFLIEIF